MKAKSKESFKEFKKRCKEKRFFSYEGFHDWLFVPPAIYISWICVSLNISANKISWLSAFVAIFGAILITSENYSVVFIGSFSYILWYLLDYVDGSVARYNNQASIEGQYLDWLMNVIANVSITSGISIAAVSEGGSLLVPFAIFSILASVLSYDRNSMAWFSIIMEYQQNQTLSNQDQSKKNIPNLDKDKESFLINKLKKWIMLFFHENYMIFLLPFFAFIQLISSNNQIDFRVVYVLLSGTFNFGIMIILINDVVREKKASKAYNDLFMDMKKPNLPKDHFFED